VCYFGFSSHWGHGLASWSHGKARNSNEVVTTRPYLGQYRFGLIEDLN
jgi:hypothetical protein